MSREQGMKRYGFVHFCLAFAVCCLISGCSSLVQKSGELLEGNTGGKTAALYRSTGGKKDDRTELKLLRLKTGEGSMEITNSAWPGLALRGNLPGQNGDFELTELRFLSSHVNGWNEFSLSLIGSASLQSSGTDALLRFTSPVERVQISSGKIRLKSSRLSGDEALKSLRNRRERIMAVVEWMQERPELPVLDNRKDFENYWEKILFPELVSKKKRPPEYSETGAEWNRAGGVRWNKTYTAFLFPEDLRELRDSGALLRDWEEASAWIYLEYSWDEFNAALDGIVLKKIKGD